LSNPGLGTAGSSIHPQQKVVRSLNLVDVIMLGIAAMIGGSIFVLTGPAIGLAGTAVSFALIINACITLFTAMGYAELGSALPEAGGGYLWVREGLPRPNAFFSGWMAWFAHIVAGSLYSVGFGSFVSSFLQMVNIVDSNTATIIHLDKIIALISIITIGFVNIRGVSETGKAGTIVTIVQLGSIVTLIVAGLWAMSNHPQWASNFKDFLPNGFTGLVSAMGLMFIAFEGYEIIVQTGDEVKNPKRNLPRAIFISLGLVVVLYCLVAFVSIGAVYLPNGSSSWKFIGENGDLGISKAAEFFMPYGGIVVLVGGIVSTLAALNATTFSSSRVAFAMGKYYNLPAKLSSIHLKFKTPYIATIISCIVMVVMAAFLPLEQIAVAAAVVFLLLFTQVNIAVISIRRMYGNKLQYGFKTPFFPYVSITGIILNLILAVYLLVTQPISWGISILWIIIGFIVYRLYTFKKELDHYAHLVTSEGDLTRKDYRILIPYTPENPDRLIRYGLCVAKKEDGEINILRVITVPTQTPLNAGIAFAQSARKSFDPLHEIIEKENVLSHYFVKISHDYNDAILVTIEEQKIDLLITDLRTFINNRKLQTLITHDMLLIQTRGDDEGLVFDNRPNKIQSFASPSSISLYAPAFNTNSEKNDVYSNVETRQNSGLHHKQKNLLVIYDNESRSELLSKTITWIESCSNYFVTILSIRNNDFRNDLNGSEKEITCLGKDDKNDNEWKYIDFENEDFHLTHRKFMQYNYFNIDINMDNFENGKFASGVILSLINTYRPDLIIFGSKIGKYNFISNTENNVLFNQINYPFIITIDYDLPGVGIVKNSFEKIGLASLFEYSISKLFKR
jgi:APA family basic amino acid/polyamine antiporter